MSSMPEASGHDLPPHPTGFRPSRSLSSGPACILVAAQFVKSPSPHRGDFPFAFPTVGVIQERQTYTRIIAARCCGLAGAQDLLSSPAQPGQPLLSGSVLSSRQTAVSRQHSLTPRCHSCNLGMTHLLIPRAGFPCCYLIFIFFCSSCHVGTVHLLQQG